MDSASLPFAYGFLVGLLASAVFVIVAVYLYYAVAQPPRQRNLPSRDCERRKG